MFSSLDTGVPLPTQELLMSRKLPGLQFLEAPYTTHIFSVSPGRLRVTTVHLVQNELLGPPSPQIQAPLYFLPRSWHHINVPVLPIRLETSRCPALLILAPESQRLFPPVQHCGYCLALAMALLSEHSGHFLASL